MKDAEKKLIDDLLKKLKESEEKNRYYEKLLAEKNGSDLLSSAVLPEEEKQEDSVPSLKEPESENAEPHKDKKCVRVSMEPIGEEHIRLFRSVFRGREEFYARRTAFSTYLRPCYNRYSKNGICPKQQGAKTPCRECEKQNFIPMNDLAVKNHLLGNREDEADVIGVYPITSKNTCWFIVFDFDDKNHDKQYQNASHNDTVTGNDASFWWDVKALADICRLYSVPYVVERSRSRLGAHVWIFFDQEIPCRDAIRFGKSLLTEGMESVNMTEFRTYDRMLPMQESLEPGQAGNLIALPLQGRTLQKGGSMFLDENYLPCQRQWDVLRNLKRFSKEELYRLLETWSLEDPYGSCSPLFEEEGDERPWDTYKTDLSASDIGGSVQIVLSDGVYIRKEYMKPRMQNRIRRLALYKNPEYFKAKKRNAEISNLKNPYYVYCGRDIGNWIRLPRGCFDKITEMMEQGKIPCEIKDERECGKKIHVSFRGTLRDNQNRVLQSLKYTSAGIISAATAFGKTVVGSALIAERQVSTLVVVNRSEIMDGWVETFEEFLEINEELPTYTTPKGRVKTRPTVIGRYGNGHHELNGILDVAMIQSLVTGGEIKEELREKLQSYGMAIVDECHHVSGEEFQEFLNTVRARSVYGFTATPKRYDSQDKKMYFQLGKIRYMFSAKDRALEQNIDHLIYPRFTSLVSPETSTNNYPVMLKYLNSDSSRNQLIAEDVMHCLKQHRTVLILTKLVEQAKQLYALLQGKADHVLLMAGKLKTSELKAMKEERKNITDQESLIMIATGSRAGEGFNYPRLDTLMLAAPVSWEGSIEQYAGRLNRDYPGKRNVIIFDYVDAAVPMFERMYRSRLKTYHMIGFDVCAAMEETQMIRNHIYDGSSFRDDFFMDLAGIQENAVLFSPFLSGKTIASLCGAMREPLLKGVAVHVVTLSADGMDEEYREGHRKKLNQLRKNGFLVSESSRKMAVSYAILDRKMIWYGCQNILGNSDEDEEVIRFEDAQAASELLKSGYLQAGILPIMNHALQTRLDL